MNVKCLRPACRVTRFHPWSLAVLAGIAVAGTAQADAVVDWNTTYDLASPAVGGPPQRAYLGAMVHIAIHDALNSIDRRYQTYNVVAPANFHASPDAAIATAARDVLINQLSRAPDSPAKIAARADVETRYAAALAAIPDGNAETSGIAAGRTAAMAIIARRTGDGFATPNLPYTLAPALGVYQPTPPALAPPAYAGWASLAPFAMTRPSQFRSGPSPVFNLKGLVYTLNYLEVKYVGSASVRGAAPDSDRSRIARFWPGGGANGNAVARAIATGRSLDRWQQARLFALLNIANVDASISVFDTKYTYNFWRPVTAIRWTNDGNPFTESDPAWLSYMPTPPYPDYTCGLTTITGSTNAVLRQYFGTDAVRYTLSATIPQAAPLPPETLTRSYRTLSQASAEAVDARVFGGMHFRDGCEQGVRQGTKVARFAFEHYLKPVRGH